MINTMQKALIIKDLRAIMANKRLFPVLIIVPLVMVLFLPSVFVAVIALTPGDEFGSIMQVMPNIAPGLDLRRMMTDLLVDSVIPLFFMIIPIMASSVMAASSFVGEKEKRTLETLLYCPLTLRQIYRAKVRASFLLSMVVSLASFVLMALTVAIESQLFLGGMKLPGLNWLITLLLVSPALSTLSIAIIVRGSAKANTVEESQQRSVFLLMPIMLAATTQFTGLIMVNEAVMTVFGLVMAVIAWRFESGAFRGFDYETLLK